MTCKCGMSLSGHSGVSSHTQASQSGALKEGWVEGRIRDPLTNNDYYWLGPYKPHFLALSRNQLCVFVYRLAPRNGQEWLTRGLVKQSALQNESAIGKLAGHPTVDRDSYISLHAGEPPCQVGFFLLSVNPLRTSQTKHVILLDIPPKTQQIAKKLPS